MTTERGRALATRARVSNLRVPNLSEIDFAALRVGCHNQTHSLQGLDEEAANGRARLPQDADAA